MIYFPAAMGCLPLGYMVQDEAPHSSTYTGKKQSKHQQWGEKSGVEYCAPGTGHEKPDPDFGEFEI